MGGLDATTEPGGSGPLVLVESGDVDAARQHLTVGKSLASWLVGCEGFTVSSDGKLLHRGREVDAAAAKRANVPTEPAGLFAGMS